MSTTSQDSDPAGTRQPVGEGGASGSDSWLGSLAALASDRVALFRHEARGAGRFLVRTVILGLVAVVASVCCWALLVAGVVAMLAVATGWAWYAWAMIAAGLHLLVALGSLLLLKSASPPEFPLTRSEFQNDRTWLQNLTTRRK